MWRLPIDLLIEVFVRPFAFLNLMEFVTQNVKGCSFLFWQAVMFNDNCVGHICKNLTIPDDFYFCAYKEVDFGRIVYDMNFSKKFETLKDAQKQAQRFVDHKFVGR